MTTDEQEPSVPPGMALIPAGDLKIREVATKVGDTYYLEMMGPILNACPGIRYVDYWELTVAEHTHLIHWIETATRRSDGGTQP